VRTHIGIPTFVHICTDAVLSGVSISTLTFVTSDGVDTFFRAATYIQINALVDIFASISNSASESIIAVTAVASNGILAHAVGTDVGVLTFVLILALAVPTQLVASLTVAFVTTVGVDARSACADAVSVLTLVRVFAVIVIVPPVTIAADTHHPSLHRLTFSVFTIIEQTTTLRLHWPLTKSFR